MNAWAQGEGQPGLGYIFWREGEAARRPGPIANNLGAGARRGDCATQLGLGVGDAVFFVAGEPTELRTSSPARRAPGSASELGLIDKDRFEFCWIVDFPMYEWNEEDKKIDFSHNPFSMPNLPAEEFLALDTDDQDKLLGLKAIQYDIVCNGIELSSGAIRNHRPDVMKKAFAIAGYDESVLEQKFGGMLHALSLGAPPHGGIAPGVDRIVMLLCGEENMREVVLFPMNQQRRGSDDGRARRGDAQAVARTPHPRHSARPAIGARRRALLRGAANLRSFRRHRDWLVAQRRDGGVVVRFQFFDSHPAQDEAKLAQNFEREPRGAAERARDLKRLALGAPPAFDGNDRGVEAAAAQERRARAETGTYGRIMRAALDARLRPAA